MDKYINLTRPRDIRSKEFNEYVDLFSKGLTDNQKTDVIVE